MRLCIIRGFIVTAAKTCGILYVVATPIGNLEDLSTRARAILSEVDVIAAEDTRHTGKLLQAIGCSTPSISLHEHNEQQRTAELLMRLHTGANVALVSDAGTPLISDPGFNLVRELVSHGVRVIPVPGACAAIAALSVAGLPTDRFVFEGFLPNKSSKRKEHLSSLNHETRTMVFYEAPHRIAEALHDLAEVFGGDRNAVVCRELTKLYETSYYGTLTELNDRAATDADMSRGEIVIVVAGCEMQEVAATTLAAEQVLDVLLKELPASKAAKLAAQICNADRAQLYELAVRRKGGDG
jgi:16S rRNA (cytidine1402-2'-O)-methyltransferase